MWRSNHRRTPCLSFFSPEHSRQLCFATDFSFLILLSLMKAWMQERCIYISKYHIEPGTPGTETCIYSLGWSGGGTGWPTVFTFPPAPQERGFSQAQLNSHQGLSQLQGQSQTSEGHGDSRVIGYFSQWGEEMLNVYSPIASSEQEVLKDLCFTEGYEWTALVLSDSTDGDSRDRHPSDYGERCQD